MYSKNTSGVKQGLPETDDLYPIGIHPRGEQHCVENRITSKVFGYFDTREEAEVCAKEAKTALDSATQPRVAPAQA